MKRLKLSCAIFSALLILVPIVCLGDGTNDVTTYPGDDFEDYSPGESIMGAAGWRTDLEIIAVAVATNVTKTGDLPMGGTGPLNISTNQVLSLDAGASMLTNLFTHITTNTYIDIMVQMKPAEKTPSVLTNDNIIQTAVYLNSSSNLVVFHATGTIFNAQINDFTTIDDITVTKDEWIRLTFEMGYTNNAVGIFAKLWFRLRVNGDLITNANAHTTVATGGGIPAPDGGSWWLCANYADNNMNHRLGSVGLSGVGLFDNFDVTSFDPFYVPPPMYTVTVVNVAGGMITPNDTKQVESNTASFVYNFDISNGWFLQSYKQGGTVIPATGPTFQIENVLSNLDLSAVWVANTTGPSSLTNGVPEGWLQTTLGIYTNDYSTAATNDSDLDGYHDADEFLMGTDPLDSNDFLRISSVTLNGSGEPVIKWRSNNIDTNYYLPPFDVLLATNMTGGPAWEPVPIASTNRVEGPHTNVVTLPFQGEIQYYYKVVATNN